MFDQILTLAMSYVQLITAALLFVVVVLELVHIGQIRRINKKLSRAGQWLQRYLSVVFLEDADEKMETEETDRKAGMKEDTEEIVKIDKTEKDKNEEVQLSAAQPLRSRQEENMRVILTHKKLRKDEELLDTVLQEIFD